MTVTALLTRRLTVLTLLAMVAVLTAWLWPHLARAPTRYEVARQLLQQNRAADAAQLFEDPVWRGIAEYRAGRYVRAIAAFDGEQSILALYDLGTTYARLQDWNSAASVLEQVLRLDPEHADARHNLDIVLQALELMRTQSPGNQQQAPSADGSDAGQDTTQAGRDDPSQDSAGNNDSETKTARDGLDQTSDDSDSGGELSDEQLSRQTATAVATGESPGQDHDSRQRINQSTLLENRESTQAAEILLRQIRDNPAKVLRARLHIAHRQRRTGDSP